jgi:hypothetical protein
MRKESRFGIDWIWIGGEGASKNPNSKMHD